MATPSVFIDGHVGTTGLRIRDWLRDRSDLQVVALDDARRKDAGARREALNAADAVVLCLPDDAAREAVGWIENPETRVIDTSTAHRVDEDWVFGLPELGAAHRARIDSARRLSNPGCYPITPILALGPLVEAGDLRPGPMAVAVYHPETPEKLLQTK